MSTAGRNSLSRKSMASSVLQHPQASLISAAKKARLDELFPTPDTSAHQMTDESDLSLQIVEDADGMDEPPPPNQEGEIPPYFNCAACQKIFWSETSLKHHQSLYHSEKSFVCEICGKAFRFRSNLAEHRSVHTSLKPYVCKFCGKSSRLKGNLTKHILKHHKKEQNAYIGKDDIIIKKGKKSIKDPAAVDFLEKSMIVISTDSGALPSAALQLYTMAQIANTTPEADESLMDSSPINGTHASELLDNSSTAVSTPDPEGDMLPVESNRMEVKHEGSEDSFQAPSPATTATVSTGAPSSVDFGSTNLASGTRCHLCGKHFRKPGSLHLHLTLKHGHPPAGSTGDAPQHNSPQYAASTSGGSHRSSPRVSSVGVASPPPLKMGNQFAQLLNGATLNGVSGGSAASPRGSNTAPSTHDSLRSTLEAISGTSLLNASQPSTTPSVLSQDIKELKEILREIRMQGGSRHSDHNPKLESLLLSLDTRVGRLEKQVESSLNSLYSLVQLQSSMNSAFSRFREDITVQLRSLQNLVTLQHANLHSD